MSIWLPPTAAKQPEVNLTSWAAHEVEVPGLEGPSVHIAGDNGTGGRVTSPVQRIEATTRSVVTSTGRVYRLHGAPGLSGDAEYVWRRWLRMFDVTVLQDVSGRLLKQFTNAEALDAVLVAPPPPEA